MLAGFTAPERWREGYSHNLVKAGRFRPVTSPFLRSKGARFYCWIKPGEWLESSQGDNPWMPCVHGGFAYLFGRGLEMTEDQVLEHYDDRSCFFDCSGSTRAAPEGAPIFPEALGPFGVLPIPLRPFLDFQTLTYTMPTSIVGWLNGLGLGDKVAQWDEVERTLGHGCDQNETLIDLAHLTSDFVAAIAKGLGLDAFQTARLENAQALLSALNDGAELQLTALGSAELFGDAICGKISPPCEITLGDGDRRKARIPLDATHFVWAYQAESQTVTDLAEALTEEQKKTLDQNSGEFAFAATGSFIYFRQGAPDHPPVVVGVNALSLGDHQNRLGTLDRETGDDAVTAAIASPEMWDGLGIGLETDIYAFGIVMWEVWMRQKAWFWMVSRATIAGTWVAFFQECQR